MKVINEKKTKIIRNVSVNIVQPDLCISRESRVREVTEKLSELYPGSQIDLRVQFLELTEDQKLADILDEEDILTVFKKTITEKEEVTPGSDKDFFVVLVSQVTRKRVFLPPAVLSGLDLTKLALNKIITVFRSVESINYFEYFLKIQIPAKIIKRRREGRRRCLWERSTTWPR